MDKTKKRILIASGGGILVVLLVWMIFRPAPVGVETASAERGRMLVTVDSEGKTRSHDRFVVTAPVAGKMSRVELHEGDAIPLGFVITGIDPAPQRPLDPPRAGDPRIGVYAYKVYSPAGGKVSRIFEPNERIVQAGTPILEISKPGRLEVVVDVLSTDAVRIQAGALVLVENWGGAETLRARVRTVEPQAFTKVSALGVEEQRVNVIADFLDSPDALGDNYRVDAKIVVWEMQDVLKAPTSALFRRGEKWSAFVVENGRARLREIETGHRNAQEAEILQGLKEAEIVILHPSNQLADGTNVKIQ